MWSCLGTHFRVTGDQPPQTLLEANRHPLFWTVVLKTIVAFCNTKGGELLIGVADDGSIVGIEHDLFPNEDKFELHLRNLLIERIAPSVAEFIEFGLVAIDGKNICHVTCKQSKRQEIWLKPDKSSPELFYVRVGPSSTELQPRQTFAYIKDHFGQ